MGRRKRSDKKLECLECGHCKTKVFETTKDLLAFCGRKSIKPNKTWIEEIRDLGRVRLVWCTQQQRNSTHGLSPRNASPRHTADIDEILRKEKNEVFISNQNKKKFIYSIGTCPHKTT